MLIGLINALVIFQTIINYILRKYLDVFIIIYFNNVLIYMNGMLEEYIKYTKKKYVFYKTEVKFLEYLVSRNRIVVNLDKAKDVLS
ncbi:hypothetical protein K469DRAFT_583376 [Zopfia rhizophila CBS 207.26]|uniref:Reverse transcriptase domain-containing protein n=1 Tax=Zopfia rhizophila CBS 207.26 TaxID=1314779 RepID=A0A6A6DX53_9PEZI|nr:hypothetical protein K469DRAFT_583376 [Zopfia rhizophila CBS 207.26]